MTDDPPPDTAPSSSERGRTSSADRTSRSGSRTDPVATYRARRDRFADARDDASRIARWLARARLATFLAVLALGVGAERSQGALALALTVTAIVGLVGFVLLVRRHGRARRRESWFAELHRLQQEGLARVARSWDQLPDPGPSPVSRDHPYAADLDVFGAVSLRALLSTVATAPGRRTLDAWLSEPSTPEQTRERQEAVHALAGAVDLRDRMAAHGRLTGDPSMASLRAFVSWCQDPDRPADRAWLVWAARLLPPTTIGLIAAHLAGAVDRAWWLLPLAGALVVTALTGSRLESVMDRAETRKARFARFARMLELLAGLSDRGDLLGRLRDAVAGDDSDRTARPAADEIHRLDRILGYAGVRHNDLVHLPFQLLFLWDVHVVRALDRWRDRTGHRVAGWMDAVGCAEALAALAVLQHDHPGWTLPEIDPASDRVDARDLEHPLLPTERSVPNDVTVGPPGTFLLVTGSNMSGKSTLLRAVGLAVVLARAGGPVPAGRLRIPPLRVHTSMRVEDSIARSVSTYMAELERLRDIVEAARSVASGADPRGTKDSPRLLYLLDEPLQGTNEAERREALRTVIRHFLRADSIGAVATHDLRLHGVDDLAKAARPVHFRGNVRHAGESPTLSFDYTLREGPATSTNALELLEMVGLGPSPDPGQGGSQNSDPS